MKANVRFSTLQGRKDDAKFHTTAEFCRIVANDVIQDIYGYFTSFYAAFIADTMQERKHESESSNDFVKRVMNKAYQTAKSTPTKVLKETELYKTFCSKNQLFKLVRTIAPCFYDAEQKHQFAKREIIAFNAVKFSSEKLQEYKDDGYQVVELDIKKDENANFPNGKKVTIVTKQFKLVDSAFSETETKRFFCSNLQETRKQRKEKFAELAESSVFYFDANDNVCTLKAYDKMNFQIMYAYVSEYAQRKNIEKVSLQQEKEKKANFQKKTMKAQQKFDAEITRTFNALLSFRNKTAKEHNNQYIADENARNLVVAGFIKLTTEYKAACQKRFADWKESENPFLHDTGIVVRTLTTEPVQPKAASKKKASTKKETKKAA